MFQESIPADSALVFLESRPRLLSFWMQNTYVPLDIAFVDAGMRIVKIASMEPESLEPVSSEVECIMAIEVFEGSFARLGITRGQRVEVNEEADDVIFTE